ncbi:MAG: hypothetical protein UW97_C0025G0007 [Parcubacteria group bacterium GW2011_GWA2_45_15]|nr:MAG: hypothetical protein UW97_C0025G0007 [Parcubacteria group bacterium GW2011_GWA2_45_15]
MLDSRAFSIATRKIGEVVSPPTCFEAVEISFAIFEKIFDLAASVTAFLFLIFDHLLCPLMRLAYRFLLPESISLIKKIPNI